MRRWLVTALVAIAAFALGAALLPAIPVVKDAVWGETNATPSVTPTTSPTTSPSPQPSTRTSPSPTPTPSATEDSFSKKKFALDTVASPWVVVNKTRPLDPVDYAPAELASLSPIPGGSGEQMTPDAAAALQQLYEAAKAAGAGFKVSTAYRSYGQQAGIYNSYVRDVGSAKAQTFSAKPGYTEHQTGLAVDVYTTDACHLKSCFADTAAAKFVAAHGHEYGFIIRYPAGKEAITGYKYEPWHLRYVGVDLATEMYLTGPYTMEEFFDLPAAPNYAD